MLKAGISPESGGRLSPWLSPLHVLSLFFFALIAQSSQLGVIKCRQGSSLAPVRASAVGYQSRHSPDKPPPNYRGIKSDEENTSCKWYRFPCVLKDLNFDLSISACKYKQRTGPTTPAGRSETALSFMLPSSDTWFGRQDS